MENRKRRGGGRSSPSFHDGKKEDSKVTQKSETVITTAEEEKFHVKEKKWSFFPFHIIHGRDWTKEKKRSQCANNESSLRLAVSTSLLCLPCKYPWAIIESCTTSCYWPLPPCITLPLAFAPEALERSGICCIWLHPQS